MLKTIQSLDGITLETKDDDGNLPLENLDDEDDINLEDSAVDDDTELENVKSMAVENSYVKEKEQAIHALKEMSFQLWSSLLSLPVSILG